MQQHRIISLLSIVVMLIIPVIGWFLIAQPQIAAAAAADQKRAAAAEQVAASQATVDQLKDDASNMPELEAALNGLRTSIPAGVDPSGYIDGLSALAKVSGVEITALTVSDPVSYVAPVPLDTSAATEGEDGEAAPPPVPPGIVTNPLIDSTNFVAIPVTIDVSGEPSTILNFVNGLQSGGRLFLVTTFSTEEGADGELTGKVGGYIWAIPTGIEGDPRPTSTIVKQMDALEDAADDEVETGEESETPDPDPTETPAP